MSVEYNAQSIETLSFRDAIRTRVAMYMGSADNMGVLENLSQTLLMKLQWVLVSASPLICLLEIEFE